MTGFNTFKENRLKDHDIREEYNKLQPKYELIRKREEIREWLEHNFHETNARIILDYLHRTIDKK